MFYDERIEKERGRIARNAILLSVLLSAVFGAIRLANILKHTEERQYLCLVILEAVLVLGGLICLLIGLIRSRTQLRDERTVFEESRFYNRAASILLRVLTAVFALFFPIVLHIGPPHNYADVPFGRILLVLAFVVGIYVNYEFRRNDIYFNYSILEEEHYYRCVFRNIGKLAIYLACLFAVSMVSFALFVAPKELEQGIVRVHILQMVGSYGIVLLELSLLYLLYSFLEKSSYSSTHRLSKATAISLGITVFLYAVFALTAIRADAMAASQAQAAQTVSAASSLKSCITFALLVFLLYFSYEYRKGKHNQLLSAGCLTILLSETLAFFAGQVWNGINNLFLEEVIERDTYEMANCLSAARTVVQSLSHLADIIGLSLLIVALIQDGVIRKGNLAAIVCLAALGGIGLFLRTQTGYLEQTIYHALAAIAALIYCCVLVFCIAGRGTADERTEAK